MEKEFKVGERYITDCKNTAIKCEKGDVIEITSIKDYYLHSKNVKTGVEMGLIGISSDYADNFLKSIKYTPQYLKENPIIVQVNNEEEEKVLFDLGLHYWKYYSTFPEERFGEKFYRYYNYEEYYGGWNKGEYCGGGYLGEDTQIIQASEILAEYNIKTETMNKKVIAYKVLIPFPSVDKVIQVGTIVDDYNYPTLFATAYLFPEFLEPVYEEEFKIGDWVYIIKPASTSNRKAGYIGKITNIIEERLADFGACTCYHIGNEVAGYQHISGIRKATPEEIANMSTFELPHSKGKLSITIEKNSFNVRGEGIFTLTELKEVVGKCSNLCKSGQLQWKVTTDMVSVGCKKGIKVSDLQKLLDRHEEIFGKDFIDLNNYLGYNIKIETREELKELSKLVELANLSDFRPEEWTTAGSKNYYYIWRNKKITNGYYGTGMELNFKDLK